jgi:fumarylacetoacetate (FAA) hydrolase
MFHPVDRPMERGWVGRLDGDRVLHLAAQTLQSFFTGGGGAREHAEYALDEVTLLPPVLHPPAVRRFDAFEEHVSLGWRARGGEIPAAWYRRPVFHYGATAPLFGAGQPVPYPEGSKELDYELQLAAVVGADGAIGGFTVLNGWTARDLEQEELEAGLGPAKACDFALSLGPVVVTPDELGTLALQMVARVNGEERSWGNAGDMHWSWERLLEHAAWNSLLRPGDVIGSGAVGGGCVRDRGDGRWLRPGDRVELEIEGIGVLDSTIA